MGAPYTAHGFRWNDQIRLQMKQRTSDRTIFMTIFIAGPPGPTAHSQVHVRVKSHSQSQFLTLHTDSGRVLPRSFPAMVCGNRQDRPFGISPVLATLSPQRQGAEVTINMCCITHGSPGGPVGLESRGARARLSPASERA